MVENQSNSTAVSLHGNDLMNKVLFKQFHNG